MKTRFSLESWDQSNQTTDVETLRPFYRLTFTPQSFVLKTHKSSHHQDKIPEGGLNGAGTATVPAQQDVSHGRSDEVRILPSPLVF